ncbi:MAG TPA: tRNA(Met) cytidine acetyltransferase [Pyrodictiaceae archaeon]|nr:tRNA(Met) cytidine acetyltransferase [Pyrodictiaceae archaeon]
MVVVVEEVHEFYKVIASSGYRGLLVLLGAPRRVYGLLSTLEVRKPLFVFWPGRSVDIARNVLENWDFVFAEHLIERLGEEHDIVVIDTYEGLRASILAAASEMVVGGGLLVLTGPTWSKWCPSISICNGFASYLKKQLYKAKNHLIVDLDDQKIISKRITLQKPAKKIRPKCLKPLPKWLCKLIATTEQARAIQAALEVFEEPRSSSLVILGDRGRGKSAALGLALAYLIAKKKVGDVAVVAPSIYSVQNLFMHMVRGLKVARIQYKAWGPKRLYEGVKGGWFKVHYEPPSQYHLSALTVVDEAAALGPARLRRIAMRARKILTATTIHGYEGSGRWLAHKLNDILPSPLMVELKTPIRYPEGDPLEEWLYDTLLLNVEPPEDKDIVIPSAVSCMEVQQLEDLQLLRRTYSILVQAHYRNSPDDLQLLLDGMGKWIKVYMLVYDGRPIAVAEVSLEDKAEKRVLTDILNRLLQDLKENRIARIVRIAVLEHLQRRGLGSRLLKCIEEKLIANDYKLVGATFSNLDIIGFWLKNGYGVAHVSARYNKFTGEKNIVVLKSLSRDIRHSINKIYTDMVVRLVYSGASVYRDLPAEKIAEILAKQPCVQIDIGDPWKLTTYQYLRLERFLKGEDYPEHVMDAMLILTALAAHKCRLKTFDVNHLTILASFVIQGKPTWEVVKVVGVSEEQLIEVLRKIAKKLASELIREVLEK